MPAEPPPSPAPPPPADADPRAPRVRRAKPVSPDAGPTRERPVLPQRSGDEEDRGWRDREDAAQRDAWFQRERPPHHE